MKRLNRTQVINGNYTLKEGWLSIGYSNHAIQRVKERTTGAIALPQAINIIRKDIYCAMAKGEDIVEFGISIPYKIGTYMVLIISNSTVKTIYFLKNKKK